MLLIVIIVSIMSILIGCTEGVSSFEDRKYEYSGDSAFEVVHTEQIDDTTINGLQIFILAHRETKVMYMQTVKWKLQNCLL